MATYVGPYAPSYYDAPQSVMVGGTSYSTQPTGLTSSSYNTGDQQLYGFDPSSTTTTSSSAPTGDVLGDVAPEPSEPDFTSQINAVFDPIMSFLGEAESSLRGSQPGIESLIEEGAATSLASAKGQQEAGEEKLKYSESQAGTRKEDALSSARRLYNEMGLGGAQRFGRGSPIGEGYQALLGREFARNRGNVFASYEDTMKNISMARSDLVRGYNDIVAQINLKKKEMLQQARQAFEDRLLAIKQNRATAESEKAAMNLENLQALRNQIYEINLATATNQSQLDTYTSNLQQKLDSLATNVSGATGSASGAYSNLLASTTTNPYSAYQVGGTTGGTQYTTPTGAISRKEEELYA